MRGLRWMVLGGLVAVGCDSGEEEGIAPGSLGATELADGAITEAELADGSVTAAKIPDGTIGANHLALDSVGTEQLAAGAVGSAQLAADSVDASHVVDGSLSSAELANGAITTAKLAARAVTADQLADGSVDGDHLADGSVTSRHIGEGTITAEALEDGAIAAWHLQTSIVDAQHLVDGAVQARHLTDALVAGRHLANGALAPRHFTTGAVRSGSIANGAITGDHIQDGQVDGDDLSAELELGTSSTGGLIELFGAGRSADGLQISAASNGWGRLFITNGTSNTKIYLGDNGTGGQALIGVAKNSASSCCDAGIAYNSSGNAYLFGNLKNFVVEHPDHPDKRIVYASQEGPEAGMYARGTVELVDGYAVVELPEHFTALAAAEGLTATVTPTSAGSLGLAVVELTPEALVVQELYSGTGTYDVHWRVDAVRAEHVDYRPVRDAAEFELLPADVEAP